MECSETGQVNSGRRWTLGWSFLAGMAVSMCGLLFVLVADNAEKPWEHRALLAVSAFPVLAGILVFAARGVNWSCRSWARRALFAVFFLAFAALYVIGFGLQGSSWRLPILAVNMLPLILAVRLVRACAGGRGGDSESTG